VNAGGGITLHEIDAVGAVGNVLVVGAYRAGGCSERCTRQRFAIDAVSVLDPKHGTRDRGPERDKVAS
jgi:hypothetical protein